jgi:hypothetical protein
MFVLTRSITIPDRHARLACLETDASLLAALGAAAGRRIVTIIHFNIRTPFLKSGFGLLARSV